MKRTQAFNDSYRRRLLYLKFLSLYKLHYCIPFCLESIPKKERKTGWLFKDPLARLVETQIDKLAED